MTETTKLQPLGSTAVLYACMVTDCWESWQESLHQTKAGAWQAGRAWLLERHGMWHKSRSLIGKSENDFIQKHQSFRVIPVTVMP